MNKNTVRERIWDPTSAEDNALIEEMNVEEAIAQTEAMLTLLRGRWKEGDAFPNAFADTAEALLTLSRSSTRHCEEPMFVAWKAIAIQCVSAMNLFGLGRPEVVKACMWLGQPWPVILNGSPSTTKRTLQKLREIGVIRKGRSVSYTTPESQIALLLHDCISCWQKNGWKWRPGMPVKWKTEKMQKSVRDLKPLDREPKNFAAWWHIAEQIFHYGWLEEYEDHDSFRHYWANETYKGMSEKVKRGLIRRDIKKAIKQAFKSIARR